MKDLEIVVQFSFFAVLIKIFFYQVHGRESQQQEEKDTVFQMGSCLIGVG